MATVYLFVFFGSLISISVSVECLLPTGDSISMFFNGVQIENHSIYEYKSNTKLTVTCKSDGVRLWFSNLNDTDHILIIVRTHNLQQNYEKSTTKNSSKKMSVSYYDGSSNEISHTFNLGPSDNGVRISCVRNNNEYGVSAILIMELSNLTEMAPKGDLETSSFTKGIGVGVAITIFFGFLCWLINTFYFTKQPRPRQPTPQPETEYYTSVYSWRKPKKPPTLSSQPSPDIFKALQSLSTKPALPSQPPPNVTNTLPNLKFPSKPSLPSQPPTDVNLAHRKFSFPSKPPLPSPMPPDVTLTLQNLPSKPSLSPQISAISRHRQFSVPALQIAKIEAVMGKK